MTETDHTVGDGIRRLADIAEREKARADGLVAKADALERVRDVLRCAESECTAAMAIGDALNIIDAALAEEPADE